MSFIKTDDKVKLYYETVGKGEPTVSYTHLRAHET